MIRQVALFALTVVPTCALPALLAGCSDEDGNASVPPVSDAGGIVADAGREPDASSSVEDAVADIVVEDRDLRACDVLLSVDQGQVLRVMFDDSAKGSSYRKGSRLGASFVSRQDASLEGTVLVLAGESGTVPISLQRVECFDREGQIVEGAKVSLRLTARRVGGDE